MQIAKCKKDLCTTHSRIASPLVPRRRNRSKRLVATICSFHFSIFNLQSQNESSFPSTQTSNLQWLSPGETSFDIVPPFNLIAFVGFPAEKNDAAIAH